MSMAELQRDKMHTSKVQKKEQYIVISVLKPDAPPILGGLSEGKESTMPRTSIITPELWNIHDGERRVYPRA